LIDWLVFNDNLSSISAISWCEQILYYINLIPRFPADINQPLRPPNSRCNTYLFSIYWEKKHLKTLWYSETCLNRILNELESGINWNPEWTGIQNKLESWMNWNPEWTGILNKLESCLNQTLNKAPMLEIFVNLTCINQTPVYSEDISWSQVCSVYRFQCIEIQNDTKCSHYMK
jgi:hypothetical protein